MLLLGFVRPAPAGAHAALAEADPPVDGVLVAPPAEVVLRFTEAVDAGAGSPAIRVINEAGDEVTAAVAALDRDDARVVRAALAPLSPGTYTVVWTARSAVDGHTLTGSHAFRYGGGRAPGAATTEGERPAAWAVATRWLTFLGMALVVGGFLVARVVIPATPGLGRVPLVTAAGAGLGVVASLVEIWLPTRWPPSGVRAPTLAEAIAGVPDAAWVRVAGLAAAVVLIAVWGFTPAIGRRLVALEWAGFGIGLVALLGLSMTSHAAARSDEWRVLALGSNILHQWSVAAWVGGLAMLAVIPAPPTGIGMADGDLAGTGPVRGRLRRFSAWALVLVIVATVTGVVNTGLVLPALAELWGSTYGRVILIKVAVLTPALTLAGLHRTSLRRGVTTVVPRALAAVGGLTGAMRATLRVETAIVAIVVLGGSTLSMLAPPAAGSVPVGSIVIADPILDATGEVTGLV
ncbi:MAG: copper resistance protein CopC, partial [Chloroflexota bacterium]|nr:copper resistance protein CopC [Chloroflexota bacterium]